MPPQNTTRERPLDTKIDDTHLAGRKNQKRVSNKRELLQLCDSPCCHCLLQINTNQGCGAVGAVQQKMTSLGHMSALQVMCRNISMKHKSHHVETSITSKPHLSSARAQSRSRCRQTTPVKRSHGMERGRKSLARREIQLARPGRGFRV